MPAEDAPDVVEVHVGEARFRAEEHADAVYGRFWSSFAAGRFEPATVAVLRANLGPGRRFVDGGAWIGPFTLLAAALGATVTAIEPDPFAIRDLRANLALNPEVAARVELLEVALATAAGRLVLDGGAHGLGNGLSRSSGVSPSRPRSGVAAGAEPRPSTLEVSAIDAAALDLDGVAVLKLDLEGAEFAVVPRLGPRLRCARPLLLLSVHGPAPGATRRVELYRRMVAAPRMARLLWAVRGYREVARIDSHRSESTHQLRWHQRVALCLRLGEMELVLQGERRRRSPRWRTAARRSAGGR